MNVKANWICSVSSLEAKIVRFMTDSQQHYMYIKTYYGNEIHPVDN